MTLEQAKEHFQYQLEGATELSDPEYLIAIEAALQRWGFTGANLRGLTAKDFDFIVVNIPPQYMMPMAQRQLVSMSRRTGRWLLQDLSFLHYAGGWVFVGELARLSQ